MSASTNAKRGFFSHVREARAVPRVRELVDDDDAVRGFGERQPDEVRADEAGPAGDDDGLHAAARITESAGHCAIVAPFGPEEVRMSEARTFPAGRVPAAEGLVQHQRGHARAAVAGAPPRDDGAGDAGLPDGPLPDDRS